MDDTAANPNLLHGYESFEAIYNDGGHHLQIFTGNASNDMIFTTANGANLQIAAGSFVDDDGNPVSGAVEIQLIEAINKSDWVMSDWPLVDTNDELLTTQGGFALTAWKAGQRLNIKNGVTLLFDGNQPSNLFGNEVYYHYNSKWNKATDASTVSVESIPGGDILEMKVNQLGGVAACKRFETTSETTTVTVSTNISASSFLDSKAYLFFDEFSGMANLPLNGTTYSTANLPLNTTATLVVVAFNNSKFYFASEEVIITENLNLSVNLRSFTKPDFFLSIRSID